MEASLARVPCVPEMDVVTMRLLRGSRSEPIDWSSDGSPAADAGSAVWEQLESVWDNKWHGTDSCNYFSSEIDSCDWGCSRSDDGSVTSTPSKSSKRLLERVLSWIREVQDARRGVLYTKSGPCNLFKDLPIPPYPEDYDWTAHG